MIQLREFALRLQSGPKKGFSLIELLVVVAIMGILMAIAVPQYLGYRERARRNTLGEKGAQPVHTLIQGCFDMVDGVAGTTELDLNCDGTPDADATGGAAGNCVSTAVGTGYLWAQLTSCGAIALPNSPYQNVTGCAAGNPLGLFGAGNCQIAIAATAVGATVKATDSQGAIIYQGAAVSR